MVMTTCVTVLVIMMSAMLMMFMFLLMTVTMMMRMAIVMIFMCRSERMVDKPVIVAAAGGVLRHGSSNSEKLKLV